MAASVTLEKDIGESAAWTKRKDSICARSAYAERGHGQTALPTVKQNIKISISETDGKNRKMISTAIYHVRIA